MGKKKKAGKHSSDYPDRGSHGRRIPTGVIIGGSVALLLAGAGLGYFSSRQHPQVSSPTVSSYAIPSPLPSLAEGAYIGERLDALVDVGNVLPSEYRMAHGFERVSDKNLFPDMSAYDRILLDKIRSQGLEGQVAGYTPVELVKGNWAVPYSVRESQLKETALGMVKGSIDDFLDFYGINFAFVVVAPKSAGEIVDASAGSKRIVYLVKETGFFEEPRYELRMRNGKLLYSSLTNRKKIAGHVSRTMHFVFERDGFRLEGNEKNPILVASDKDDIYRAESGPSEIFHEVASADTVRHTQNALSGYSAGKEVVDGEVISQISRAWLRREEHVVHTAVTVWLLDYAKRTGKYPDEEIQKRIGRFRLEESYSNVPDMVNRFRGKQGIGELRRLYRDSPDVIFRPYGF
ncbi:hypothetical protein HYY72_03020 [Candidatus Woesearchaeota archaeon]|nr:hypothetical protein [Candidatus Woesearchaeota archaeon]